MTGNVTGVDWRCYVSNANEVLTETVQVPSKVNCRYFYISYCVVADVAGWVRIKSWEGDLVI